VIFAISLADVAGGGMREEGGIMGPKGNAGSVKNRGGDGVAINKLRKFFIFALSIALCFAVTACSGNGSNNQLEDDSGQSASNTSSNASNNSDSNTADNPAGDLGENILVTKNCGKCHAISPLGIEGNGTGPDLANAASDVKTRFGISLEEFMEDPQGTMYAYLGSKPLTADEKQQIIETIRSYE